ncbi:unnamed protein product [Urochloa humidicola]
MANHGLVLGHGQDDELALGQNHHEFNQDHGLDFGHELDLGGHHHDHDIILDQSHEHDHDLVTVSRMTMTWGWSTTMTTTSWSLDTTTPGSWL